jgi:hypothetical protein
MRLNKLLKYQEGLSPLGEAWSPDSGKPAFEPCLFEPESLFPGNRILGAETKATKVHEDTSRDEAHAKQVG